MTPRQNSILKWTGIAFVSVPTLVVVISGIYSYSTLLEGMFYMDFYRYPTYTFISDSYVAAVYIIVNIRFWGSLILSWFFIFKGKLRKKYKGFFLLCSMIPLAMFMTNRTIEPRGRMLSARGNHTIRFIEKVNGRSVIRTYVNEKESEEYNRAERPRWILLRKDTIPENW